MNDTIDTNAERRQYHELRKVFVSCCDFLTPIVVANVKTKTVSSFAMARMVADRFPDLSSAEIHIAILTVEKLDQQTRMRSMAGKSN
jgi:hypothetical protein